MSKQQNAFFFMLQSMFFYFFNFSRLTTDYLQLINSNLRITPERVWTQFWITEMLPNIAEHNNNINDWPIII